MKVFISYSHAQKDWVLDRLWPCLDAGGANVLIFQCHIMTGIATAGL